jgi:N-acetylglucosamine kinase-like BadF-type ATPase
LHIRLHETESPVNDIAQFARDVLDASATNPTAAQIVDDAATRLLATMTDALVAFPDGSVAVALGGRLLEGSSPLRERLDSLAAEQHRFSARSADGTPLEGALQLGSFASPGPYRELIHIWKEEEAA